ncbi:MAG: glycoside hydrolase family 66 protein, partial [Chloroflexota bacterium]
MRIVDFYPSQGSFAPGEIVTFLIELETSQSQDITLRILIHHLGEQIAVIEESVQLVSGEQILQINWTPPINSAGYSARLEILSFHATTAFDVLASWTDFPRYGFLTDFSASRADPETV